MTPFAVKCWQKPLAPRARGRLGEFLAGAQFFDVQALEPIVRVRSQMEDSDHVMEELIGAQIPAEKTWLQIASDAAFAISDSPKMLEPGERFACLMAIGHKAAEGPTLIEFRIFTHSKRLRFFSQQLAGNQDVRRAATRMIRSAWFSIEAMQTPGGLCHSVTRNPTRQQLRRSSRQDAPCHRWVEIRLGKGMRTGSGAKHEPGRTVAWHYRRGHRVQHPNPNYPKWRKGTWVGDVSAGIRTHHYTVEVPQ